MFVISWGGGSRNCLGGVLARAFPRGMTSGTISAGEAKMAKRRCGRASTKSSIASHSPIASASALGSRFRRQ